MVGDQIISCNNTIINMFQIINSDSMKMKLGGFASYYYLTTMPTVKLPEIQECSTANASYNS